MKYDFTAIEKKWQEKWLEEKPFTAVTGDKTREKFYGLIEFPYPSGQGLHVGHARPFTAMDIICRKKRMQGYNVLFPIGFDAFGLPTENYAIKNHVHPAIVRDFQAVISKEIKEQMLEKEGRLPDVVLACVGGGSNAIGTFYNFIEDKDVRLIGCEAAGRTAEAAGGRAAGNRNPYGSFD